MNESKKDRDDAREKFMEKIVVQGAGNDIFDGISNDKKKKKLKDI